MKLILAFVLTASLFGIPMIYGEMSQLINLELESSDIKISFGDVGFKQNISGKSTIYNILDEITISGKVLNEAYLKTYINSFSIKDVSNEFAMWATPNTFTPYEDDYKVTVFYEGIRFQTTLNVPIVEEIVPTEVIQSIEQENIDLLIVGDYSMVTALKDQINFDLRIYDEALNISKDYNTNYGYVADADVTISIKDSQNKIIWLIEEKTDQFGRIDVEFRVESNFTLLGEYLVSIQIEYNDNTLKQTLPLFIEQQNADVIWMDILRLE